MDFPTPTSASSFILDCFTSCGGGPILFSFSFFFFYFSILFFSFLFSSGFYLLFVFLSQILCAIVAGVLHYLFLVAFAWMCLEGILLYIMLIEVFEAESRRTVFYFFGYGRYTGLFENVCFALSFHVLKFIFVIIVCLSFIRMFMYLMILFLLIVLMNVLFLERCFFVLILKNTRISVSTLTFLSFAL